MQHISVLREDVQKYLSLRPGEVVVDGTLGLGGHSLDIAEKIGKKGVLIAFDLDERNLTFAKKRLEEVAAKIHFFNDNFCYLKTRITGIGIQQVDAILLDLGLSSPHVDESERGFSFMANGPLDMRYDQRNSLTAAEIVNSWPEEEIARIIFEYGEERFSRKIAKKIVERRKSKPIITTHDLANLVENVYPKKRAGKKSKSHPATQTFQALRIAVNDEFEVLKDVLAQSAEMLKVGGRIVIISYHSLEDRLVKQFFKDLIQPKATEEESVYQVHGDPYFEALTKKPVTPSEKEITLNPRSRSAKLRAYKKIKNIT